MKKQKERKRMNLKKFLLKLKLFIIQVQRLQTTKKLILDLKI